MSESSAIVIGGGIGGLVAAAYLARGGARVTLLEARETLGGEAETAPITYGFSAPYIAHTLYALDARMVRELRLHQHGLAFAERDMKLVALRPGGQHIVIARDAYAARSSIAARAPADTDAYARFRRETLALARRLRPLWTGAVADRAEATPEGAARALKLSHAEAERLALLARMSVSAYLDRWFESDALKAALAFDVAAEGFSPQEAGSALALIWRYAQESCGLQAAVSQAKGGPGALAQALAQAAQEAGAELRTGARVQAITVEAGKPTGVTLDNGEALPAMAVLSSLSARRTLLELAPAHVLGFGGTGPLASPAVGTGTAKLLLALNGLPPFAGLEQAALRGRLVVAERPESAAEAKGAALAGRLPNDFVLEATVPSLADPSLAPNGQHVLSVSVPYLPLLSESEWAVRRDVLADRIIATLEAYAPGLRERIVERELLTPTDIAQRYGVEAGDSQPALSRMLSSCATRVRTKLSGLYLCGAPAEPCSAISGCAGRVAASLVLAELGGAK
jgi:phytoene dehydrogenase-like protein